MKNKDLIIAKLYELVEHVGGTSPERCAECKRFVEEISALESEPQCEHNNWVKEYHYRKCIDCGHILLGESEPDKEQKMVEIRAQREEDRDMESTTSQQAEWENKAENRWVKFFDNEVDLGFCTKTYAERVKWYIETYPDTFASQSLPEISDEEIEVKCNDIADCYSKRDFQRGEWLGFKEGAKWYKDELKRRLK